MVVIFLSIAYFDLSRVRGLHERGRNLKIKRIYRQNVFGFDFFNICFFANKRVHL